MSPPELAPGDVHLWLAFETDITAGDLLAAYRALLTDDERAREARFRFEAGRRQFLITRALERTVLSHYCAVPPEEWRFTRDRHGRPHIETPAVAAPAFNLSHTDGLVACAVTLNPDIGVDVERLHHPQRPLALADRFFSEQEANALRALPAHAQPERFLEYWTLKESYIKARGLGLALPLRDFAFTLAEERDLDIAFAGGADSAAAWKFWLLRPSAAHLAAVCTTRAPANRLVVRRCVPLRSATVLASPITRES